MITVVGQQVARVGFGTMRLTGLRIYGPPADRAEAVRVLRRAVELGVRVIDTACQVAHLEENLAAADLTLSDEDVAALVSAG